MTPAQKIACYQIAADAAVEDFVISRISNEAKTILLGKLPPKENAGATAIEDFDLLEARYPDVRPFIWAFRRTELGKRVRDRLREADE